MSNVNDWVFAKHLDNFKAKLLDPQAKRVQEADAIMSDPNYKWSDDAQKNSAIAKHASYKAWLQFYQQFYDEGMKLCTQHETMVDHLSKWYSKWYNDISNDGRQEVELMSCQADWLNEIFTEIFNDLKPLNLEGIKTPQALNMK
jgi:hypothetical protein